MFLLHLLQGEHLLFECKCCNVILKLTELWGLKPFERSKDSCKLSTAMNGICCQTDHVEFFEFPRFNVAVFLSGLGLWVSQSLPRKA